MYYEYVRPNTEFFLHDFSFEKPHMMNKKISLMKFGNYHKEIVSSFDRINEACYRFANDLIDEEINYRNEQLKYADDTEKSIINERINELNNNKATQQITFNEYLSAAKIEKEKSKTANLTANNLNAEEDDFSNLKYNNKYNYKSNQSKSLLNDIATLKQEAAQLDEESEIIINSVANMSSPEEKTAAVAKSEDLDKQSQKKQNEIAKIYENANRNEFYNNESILSNLTKANKDPYSDNVILAEMLSDESVSFYERAAEEREKAKNASSFTSKEINLQKAYQYEMKAIEKLFNL